MSEGPTLEAIASLMNQQGIGANPERLFVSPGDSVDWWTRNNVNPNKLGTGLGQLAKSFNPAPGPNFPRMPSGGQVQSTVRQGRGLGLQLQPNPIVDALGLGANVPIIR